MADKNSKGIIERIVSGSIVVAGAVLYVINTVPDVKESVAIWGIPSWGWQLIALAIVIGGFGFILYTVHQDNRRITTAYDASLLEQRRGMRNRLSDRFEIPNILKRMFERATKATEIEIAQTKFPSKKVMHRVGDKLMKAGYLDPNSSFMRNVKVIEESRNPLDIPLKSRKLKSYEDEMVKFILGLQAAMGVENVGTMIICASDTEYQQLNAELVRLEVGLPKLILVKIQSYILLTNALANLQYLDLEADPQSNLALAVPYLEVGFQAWAKRLNSEIASLIERFLMGEDM